MPDLQISSVEFNQTKQNIKDYLKSQTEFLDYNFEASGMSILLDTLAYAVHYLSFYLSMTTNESFLDTVQLLKNAIAISKSLGYSPRRMTGANAIISLEIKDAWKPTNPATVITVPKFTDFTVEGVNFFTTEEYLLTATNNYKFSSVEIRQGIYKTESHTSDGAVTQTIEIKNAAIDNETLEVWVDGTLWAQSNDLTTITAGTESYSVQLTEDNYVQIIFGDGVLGKVPPIGNTIQIIYTETLGSVTNNYTAFVLNGILSDNYTGTYDASKVTVINIEQSSGGADYETLDSIKLNAPKYYASQGRAVTKTDYEAILSQHPLVESLNVFGGETIIENPVFGTVYIAVKPVGSYNLTASQKTTLMSYLGSKNVLTINPAFIDVSYFNVDISGTIYYKQLYENQLPTIRTDVETAIADFFTGMIAFDDIFKAAKFTSTLNDLEKITNTNLVLSPFFYFSKVPTGNYRWSLDNALVPGSIICNISSTEGFYDDSLGNLKTKATGNAVGEVDYANGIIEIYPGFTITETEPGAGFSCYFKTLYDDIKYARQRKVIAGTLALTYTRYV